MANTTLTQTGAQVQADLNKVEGMAEIKTVGSGLTLSSVGELSASGTKLYNHKIEYASSVNETLIFNVITTDNTPVSTWQDLRDLINASVFFEATGVDKDNKNVVIMGNAISMHSAGWIIVAVIMPSTYNGRGSVIMKFDTSTSEFKLDVSFAFTSGVQVTSDVVTAL